MKRNDLFVMVVVWLSVILTGCSAKTDVMYRVTGTASEAAILFVTQDGEQEITKNLPFVAHFETGSEFSFKLYATNVSDQGTVKCEVILDEESLAEAEGENFAGCEGTFRKHGGNAERHVKTYDDVIPEGFVLPVPQAAATEVRVQPQPDQINLGGALVMALGKSEYVTALYLLDTASGEIVQWTEPLGFIGCADWSPVEAKIALDAGGAGDVHTYVMTLEGAEPVQLTDITTESPGGDGCPDWSPDGSKITLDARAPDGHHIFTMDADGTAREQITTGEKIIVGSPDWSPDGSKILFKWLQDYMIASIRVMNSDGTESLALIESDTDAYISPVWSPDGRQIAFIRDVKGPEAFIYLMDANGEDVRAVTEQPFNNLSSLAWTPDGSRLIFNALEPDAEVGFRGIYAINLDGSDLIFLGGLPDTDLYELRFVPAGYINTLPSEPVLFPSQ